MRDDRPGNGQFISMFSALRFRTRLPMNWYRLAIVLVIIDQLTKLWASTALDYNEPVPILPFFDIVLHHNTGAAFSFLHDAGGWQRWLFSAIAGGVGIGIVIWMARLKRGQTLLMTSLTLVLGGAIGNVIDRVRFGYVVDFISIYWPDLYRFPTFNFADSAITIGAALMLLDMVRNPQNHGSAPRAGSEK
jgi:signal peptidase II